MRNDLQMPVSQEEQQKQEEAKQAAEEQRRGMLMALMEPGARERRMSVLPWT